MDVIISRDKVTENNMVGSGCSRAGKNLKRGGKRAGKSGKKLTTECKNAAHKFKGKGNYVDKTQRRVGGKWAKRRTSSRKKR